MVRTEKDLADDKSSGASSDDGSIKYYNDVQMALIIDKIKACSSNIIGNFNEIVDKNLTRMYTETNWKSSTRTAYVNACKSLVATNLTVENVLKNINDYLDQVQENYVKVSKGGVIVKNVQ